MTTSKKWVNLSLLFSILFVICIENVISIPGNKKIEAVENNIIEPTLQLSSEISAEPNQISLNLTILNQVTNEIDILIPVGATLVEYSLDDVNTTKFSVVANSEKIIITPNTDKTQMEENSLSDVAIEKNIVTLRLNFENNQKIDFIATTFQNENVITSNTETVLLGNEELEEQTKPEPQIKPEEDGKEAEDLNEEVDEEGTQAVEEESIEEESIEEEAVVDETDALVRNIYDNLPKNRLVIKEKFRNPIGKGANFLEPTILELSSAKSQTGSIWSKNKLDFKENFSLKTYIYLGNSKRSAGDGITFTLQNDERMDSDPNAVIGGSGFGLGAYGTKIGSNYIHNALSIEFDTFYNEGSGNRIDRELKRNNYYGHIAVVTPKESNNNYNGEHSYAQYSKKYLSNGTWRAFTVNWDSETQSLNYQLEGFDAVNVPIDVQDSFKGQEAFWGFTSSTGKYWAQNAIIISELPQELKASQDVGIKNITQKTELGSEISANPGDIVEYRISNNFLSGNSEWENVATHAFLPEGVSYVPNSTQVDGVSTSDENIEINTNEMIFPKKTLSDDYKNQVVIFRGKVTAKDGPKKLVTEFKAVGDNATIEDRKTEINLNKTKVGQVVVRYLDEYNQPVAQDMTLLGDVGDPYSIERKEFSDYLLSEIPLNENGLFSESPTVVVYRYERRQIKLVSVPSEINFGEELKISNKPEVYPVTEMTDSLAVQDTRSIKSKWSITSKISKKFESKTGHLLSNALYYTHLGREQILGTEAISVYDHISKDNEVFSISDKWNSQEGLKLKITPGASFPEEYRGEISWTLQDAPAND